MLFNTKGRNNLQLQTQKFIGQNKVKICKLQSQNFKLLG